MRFRTVAFIAALIGPLFAASKLSAAEPPVIATTDALTPAEERKAFTVPPGFEVQLVASEPDIQKPIQMAFDARGRLWVTTSHHYPFAAPPGEAKDKLFVLSDFDPNTGKARKIEIFADSLNIPIGILPLPDCQSCIVSSAGEIRKYTDTKGTGKADKMEVLYSGFGFSDTHGMYNSFTYMPDGWVYACHGYSNSSSVKGKDGKEVKMHSGNSFRFRPDGSHIEAYTRGQVNPFGIAIDPWFNLYTADCHSKPITQLIPGGYYDSFGKPHDGLGYAPHVTIHGHGSTALCGLTWYDAPQFPKEYLGTMFLGNVVTNRINFDKIVWKGATPVGIEQPDFLVSKDPWFRPVDIKLAPDGTLFVSDFYNKIIGHYEVDLRHPLRDKDRARIWRIVWKGTDGKAPAPKSPQADFTTATDSELQDCLLHPNLTARFLAGHQLRRRAAEGVGSVGGGSFLDKVLKNPDQMTAVFAWLMFCEEASEKKLQPKDYDQVVQAAKGQVDSGRLTLNQLGGQVVRALASRENWGDDERKILLDIFNSFDSMHVRFACVEAATFHPHADFVKVLIETIKKCPAEDTHMRQAARIALRNCLRDNPKAWPSIDPKNPRANDPIYGEMAVAIQNADAADYLGALLYLDALPPERMTAAAEHVARNGETRIKEIVFYHLSIANEFSSARGEALLGYLRANQSRGEKLDGNSRDSLVSLAESQLLGTKEKKDLDADTVKKLLAISRLLQSLPALSKEWTEQSLTDQGKKSLAVLMKRSNCPPELRIAAGEALLSLSPMYGVKATRELLSDTTTPPNVRDRVLLALAASPDRDARLDARDALKDVPYRLAIAIGTALASTSNGAEDLLEAVKQGKAPARLLQERAILERLRGAKVPDLDKRIAALTKGLTAPDQRLAAVMQQRAKGFTAAKPDKELGAKLFAKHCGACHRIADQGGKIAPQLDGIGIRGLERLLEDVLDPNRNVDQAFRARVITTADGRTITGLMLRVEGEVLLLADGEGKEVRIPLKEIETNRETMLSPMPANFADVIPEGDFYHLMAFLLDQKANKK